MLFEFALWSAFTLVPFSMLVATARITASTGVAAGGGGIRTVTCW